MGFLKILALWFLIYLKITDSAWVEIPQVTSESYKGLFTKRPDFSSTFFTTTSTTPSVTIIPKPFAKKRNNFSNFTTTHMKGIATEQSKSNEYGYSGYSTIPTHQNVEDEVNCNEPLIEKEKVESYNNFSSFIPFLTTVQSTLMRNAHHNIKSKMDVLENLKDNMLFEIEDRMSELELIKSKDSERIKRDAREYKDDSHMDFPSNEGALMTIGFLTFGVFLIKLIMHLVSAVKSKTMTMGRKRRSVDINNQLEVLKAIDEYIYK